MNIPDEAKRRYPNTTEHWTGWIEEARQIAFRDGAEWARKEALREAAKLAAQARTNVEAMQAIRALAEGDNSV